MKRNLRVLKKQCGNVTTQVKREMAEMEAEGVKMPTRRQFKTVFISDCHLGSSASRAEELLEFLSEIDCETLYLIGDIVDLWCPLERSFKPKHQAVLKRIIFMAHMGTKLIYIPGNHDPIYRGVNRIFDHSFEIMDECVYENNGRRYLVLHGDIADQICSEKPAIAFWGSKLGHILRNAGEFRNFVAALFGLSRSEFFNKIMHKICTMQERHSGQVDILTDVAHQHGADGVICGHFHVPMRVMKNQIDYINCGDWIDHCTALVETLSGSLVLQSFAETTYSNTYAIYEDAELDPLGAS